MNDEKNQKNDWDKKPITVKIRNEDLTERVDVDDYFRKLKEDAEKNKNQAKGKADGKKAPVEEIKRTLKYPRKTKLPTGATLGEILREITSLPEQRINECIEAQKTGKENSDMIGEILLKRKHITEDDLIEALSIQLNMPIIELENEKFDLDLVNQVPINFAKKHNLIPVRKVEDKILVAIANAIDYQPMDDLRILLDSDLRPVLAKKNAITDAINRLYNRDTKQADKELIQELDESNVGELSLDEPKDLLDAADEAPIIKLVNSLMFRAVKERASDIHFRPLEKDLSVKFRIDGILYDIMKIPRRAQASVSSRIKIMAQLDIAEKRIPQDGRIQIKIAGRDIDIRVSTLPTSFGENIVLRLLDRSAVLKDMSEIGLADEEHATVNQIIKMSHGIFLVTGPTGSGKTTTLYAALTKINTSEKNIITVEDPVEYQLQGIGQIHVNPKVNLTFANGLRSILRQDPDVIMVGEIRDVETAEIAIQASLTGHLVLSTLHTNDSSTAITRLIDMGVEAFLVSSSLVAVMAQRLVRVLCKSCRETYTPSTEEIAEIGLTQEEVKGKMICRAKGCQACGNTGYSGRTGIYELLRVDDEIRGLILKNADSSTIMKAAVKRGMKSLRADGAHKITKGITTVAEVLRVTQEDLAFE
jgi:general secretion pathway protein E